MSKAISERVELAKLCSSRDWSKVIRVLDSLLASSPSSIQDICNRAFCYSQLELHKHVIKDCDRALQLDPTLLQAYILKGHALSSLGRKDDALLMWGQGYERALCQSADLKQLLELEELLKSVNQGRSMGHDNCAPELGSLKDASESGAYSKGKLSEVPKKQEKLSNLTYLSGKTTDESKTHIMPGDNFRMLNGRSDENRVENSSILQNGTTDEAGDNSPMPLPESEHFVNGNFKSSISEPCISQDKFKIPGDWRGTLEKCSSVDEFEFQNGSSDEAGKNIKPKTQLNGSNHILDKRSDDFESFSKSSKVSGPSNSGDTNDIQIKFSAKSDAYNEGSDEATKRSKKLSVAKISKTKSISVDFRLSRGIAQVNEGKYATAISIFDQILKGDPNYPEALIGRGTAYAFQRELEAAIADFSKAIQSNPSAGEAWKRRGQARAALGESVEAIEDLTKALEFEPNSGDILHERGIVNFKFKDYDAAVEDLSACVKLDKDNKSAYTYLGLALASVGEHKRAEEAHLKAIQLDRNLLEAWAHLTQFYHDLANSTKALECIQQVLHIDARFAKAFHLRGRLLHGMGEHRKAIKDLSVSLSIDKSNIDSLYLRASCYHAIGDYSEAVKDYDATLDLELDSMEKFVLQCLAFYQKEIALYTASKTNSEFCWFDIDGDIDPLFKEYWCKRLHPKDVCEKVYRQTPLRESLKRGKLRKQDFAFTKQKTALIVAADSIGQKIQYDCPGFLPNRRQHRMAGLAAIEIAQKVSKVWRSLQAEWKHSNKGTPKYGKRPRRRINMPSQNRGGAGCSTSSSSETSTSYGVGEDRSSGRSLMSWHDLYSLAVKWRQISEPCDPVVWVNKLSEEFNSGFGSHTPMVLGQAKVVRYYPNFERTLNVAKSIIKDKMYLYNKADDIVHISDDEKLQDIMNSKSCSDLYRVVGEDFWVAAQCSSTAYEGKQLEGTRITVVKLDEHGFDFAIRTPCTPSRWDDFDEEMAKAWEAICNAYCGETYGSLDFSVLENVREAILRLTYYWYNFMPLSRGSAVVGFVVLLGLLLAANMEFTGEIPKDLQVDWEAILNFDPKYFVESVKSWLYPCLKVSPSWKDYPDVASTFSTTGSVVAALSSYDD